ncbi:MCE family protein [Mycolicibacterium flavescens]|uniref:Mammalian cell entry protein n=1 Tax=Mycolicibacterium flavescens TaxID=1776 RepID=A0A1E3RDR1_MYCFV|nr:MCE family protein [Mycolicibacterium flavescens]MCV7282443.1 MCE family protein [Mycolicibacterium flavescens]ODQ87981.1 mammalian cell entry protein [Mycolicibacterium flavescens]
MKSFQERNPLTIGIIGVLLFVGISVAAVNYDKLPGLSLGKDYSAYFAEAGGLRQGADVRVSGVTAGKVDSVKLDGAQVLVSFKVRDDIRVGDRSEVAVKTSSVLGAKVLEVTPRGEGSQSGPIPLQRTTSAYQLPDAIGDLTTAISGLDTDQLSESLEVLAQTFADTPPDVRAAVEGVGRFSKTLADRDAELRSLLSNAEKSTTILAERSDKIVSLVHDTNELLAALQEQSSALDQFFGNLSAVSRQLDGFIAENRTELKPALEKLNGVLAIVDNHRAEVRQAVLGLNRYALGLGESVGSGPFFKAYVVNLFPGQFVQPFIDAAFSDLGLDPNVLAPTERADPQVGQPGTPALPVPFPRTGQGGEPRMTVPDAITGNPGDQQCGPPGVPLPGPGCYPYREPLPAPPPGGPPPGPPAPAAPGMEETPPPPTPVYRPSPGDTTHGGGGQ